MFRFSSLPVLLIALPGWWFHLQIVFAVTDVQAFLAEPHPVAGEAPVSGESKDENNH